MNHDILYPQNWIVFLIFTLIYIVVLLGLIFTKKANETVKKVIAAVWAVLGLSLLVYIAANPVRIGVGQDKIEINAFLHKVILYKNISTIDFFDTIETTEYAPRTRTIGVSLGDVEFGYFVLANGKIGFTLIEGRNPVCVITDNEGIYLLSPPTEYQAFQDVFLKLKEELKK